MIEVRGSSADRIDACPPSAIPPKVAIDIRTPEGEAGTAIHSQIATMLTSTSKLQLALADVTGDSDLLDYAEEAWQELDKELPPGDLCIEAELRRRIDPTLTISGHPDLSRRADDHGAETSALGLADWKGGHRSEIGSCMWQLLVYAWLLGPAPRVVAFAVYLRDRVYDRYDWTGDYVEARIAELVKKIKHAADYPFSPGGCCRYCPRQFECPAHEAVCGSMVRSLGDSADLTTSPQQIVNMLTAWPILVAKMQATKAVWRRQIQQGTPIIGKTHEVALTKNVKHPVNMRAGLTVLRAHLTEDQLWGLATTSKTAVEKAVKANVPKGQGAKQARSMFKALEDAGAIATVFGDPKLVLKKRKETDDDNGGE